MSARNLGEQRSLLVARRKRVGVHDAVDREVESMVPRDGDEAVQRGVERCCLHGGFSRPGNSATSAWPPPAPPPVPLAAFPLPAGPALSPARSASRAVLERFQPP